MEKKTFIVKSFKVESALKEIYKGDPGPLARSLLGSPSPVRRDVYSPGIPCLVKVKEEEEINFEDEMCEKADIAMEEDGDSEGNAEERDEESDADANDNMVDHSEDGDWAPSVAKGEMLEEDLVDTRNSSNLKPGLTASSLSALGRKRGPYKKRQKRAPGELPYVPATRECHYCNTKQRNIRSASGLKKHEKECLREVLESQKCRKCPDEPAIVERQEFLEHLTSHGATLENPCSADNCPESFRSEALRLKHEQKEHGKNLEAGLAERPRFRYSWSEHSVGMDAEECNCGIEFSGRYERVQHHRFYHSKLPSFACQYCTKLNAFTTNEMVNEHEEYWHKHWCPEDGCAFSCESEKKLQNHLFREHKYPMPAKQTENNEKVTICCEICGKQFDNKKSLRYHKDVHKEEVLPCPHCDKVFHRKLNYGLHISQMHSGQTFICETCSATFTSRRNLKLHIAAHHEERKLQCHLCPKAFTQANKLKQHMTSVHIKDTPFKCKYGCGRAYNDKSNLRQHERRQHEDDPLIRKNKTYSNDF